MTHEHSATKCDYCGRVEFDNGEVEYFVGYDRLRNYDVEIKECENHEK